MASKCGGDPPVTSDLDVPVTVCDGPVFTAGDVETDTGKVDNCSNGDSVVERTKRPPRSEKKRRRHEEQLQQQRENRKKKKMERKIRMREENPEKAYEDRKNDREMKAEMKRRCEEALKSGQKICIDCSLGQLMSDKEVGKLAMQIGRLYGSNKKVDVPAHIYLTGLNPDGLLYKECLKKNDGFLNYLIDRNAESHTELFPLDNIVYLSPDSDKVLNDIDPEKIYIIGGLVDESIAKNVTKTRSDEAGVSTARLPIEEHMDRIEQASYSKVLSVNQVFDILLTYLSTKSWKTALSVGVPRRKGYVVRTEDKT